jgi:hypothetical protein
MKLAELQTLMESLMDRVGRLEHVVADASAADTVVSHHSRELDRQTDLLHEIRQVQAQHTATLDEVAVVQAQHGEKLATLDQVAAVQAQHTATLDEVAVVQAQHTATLDEVAVVQAQHTNVLRMITDHLRITDAS